MHDILTETLLKPAAIGWFSTVGTGTGFCCSENENKQGSATAAWIWIGHVLAADSPAVRWTHRGFCFVYFIAKARNRGRRRRRGGCLTPSQVVDQQGDQRSNQQQDDDDGRCDSASVIGLLRAYGEQWTFGVQSAVTAGMSVSLDAHAGRKTIVKNTNEWAAPHSDWLSLRLTLKLS